MAFLFAIEKLPAFGASLFNQTIFVGKLWAKIEEREGLARRFLNQYWTDTNNVAFIAKLNENKVGARLIFIVW